MAQYTEYHPLKFWLDPASIAEIVAHIQTYLVNNPINSTTEIETIIHDYLIAHPELIGGVDSVNGQTGEVVLTADNISGGENVTIKDVLDSLQDQIDDIVVSIPSDYQQLIDDVSDLKSAIASIYNADQENLSNTAWTIGTIDTETGEDSTTASTNRIRTGYIDVSKITSIILSVNSGYKYIYYLYDANKTKIEHNGWFTNTQTVTITSGIKYIRLLLSDINNGPASLSYKYELTALAKTPYYNEISTAKTLGYSTYFANGAAPRFYGEADNANSNIVVTFPNAEFRIYRNDGSRLVSTTEYTNAVFTINNLQKLIFDRSNNTVSVVSVTRDNNNAITLFQVLGNSFSGLFYGYYAAHISADYGIDAIKQLQTVSDVSIINYDNWEIGSLSSEAGQPISSSTRVRSGEYYDISNLYGFEIKIATGYRFIVFFFDTDGNIVNINNRLQWNTTTIKYFASEWGNAVKIKFIISDVNNGQAALNYARNLTVFALDKINTFANRLNTINSTSLAVMSFNVQRWTGLNSNYPLMADIIYKYMPDILCIQEQATNPGAITNSFLTNFRNYVQSSGITTPLGIYSKFEFLSSESVVYQTQGSETRGYIHVSIEYNKNVIHIFTTHLDLDRTTRIAQATELFNAANDYEYSIICGDFNSFEASSVDGADYVGVIKQFIDAGMHSLNCSYQHGFLATYYNGNTIAASTLMHCLDQIITTPNVDIESVFVDKLKDNPNNANVIDHLPLVAYCRVNG